MQQKAKVAAVKSIIKFDVEKTDIFELSTASSSSVKQQSMKVTSKHSLMETSGTRVNKQMKMPRQRALKLTLLLLSHQANSSLRSRVSNKEIPRKMDPLNLVPRKRLLSQPLPQQEMTRLMMRGCQST